MGHNEVLLVFTGRPVKKLRVNTLLLTKKNSPTKFYQFLPAVRFGINVSSLSFSTQRQVADASMHIPTLLGFLTIAKATKLADVAVGVVAPGIVAPGVVSAGVVAAGIEPSDTVVVEALGKGWQENTDCVDIMARNGE